MVWNVRNLGRTDLVNSKEREDGIGPVRLLDLRISVFKFVSFPNWDEIFPDILLNDKSKNVNSEKS